MPPLVLGVLPDWLKALPSVAQVCLVAIPLGFLVAIAFHQFLDIDRLFGATLSYSMLAILGFAMLAGVFAGVPRLAAALGPGVGLDWTAGQLILSFGLLASPSPAPPADRAPVFSRAVHARARDRNPAARSGNLWRTRGAAQPDR